MYSILHETQSQKESRSTHTIIRKQLEIQRKSESIIHENASGTNCYVMNELECSL
jgi:hypothetical protein